MLVNQFGGKIPAAGGGGGDLPTANLLVHYKLNGDITDEQGNYDGVLSALDLDYATGLSGQQYAHRFDAVNYFHGNDSGTILAAMGSGFTCTAWFKNKTTEDTGYLIANAAGSNPRFYVRYVSTSNLFRTYAISSSGSQIMSDTSTSLADDSWHHICVTYDGTGSSAWFKMYLDNVDYSTSPGAISPHVFSGATASMDFLQCKYATGMQDIRIYTRAITSDERLALFQEHTP